MESSPTVADSGGTGSVQTPPHEHDHKNVGDSLDSSTLVGVLRAHLPAFACGAATFWLLQNILFSNSQDEQACFGVQHMADALHAEVDVSRRLLEECQRELRLVQVTLDRVPKSLRDVLAQIPHLETTSAPLHGDAATTNDAGSKQGTLSRVTQHLELNISAAATAHEVAGRRLQLLSGVQDTTAAALPFSLGICLCLLDAGLLFFCLRQLLSQDSQDLLGHLLTCALSRLRLLQQDKGSVAKDGHNQSAPPQLSRVDPSGGHMLIRRPDRASAFQRSAEEAAARGAGAESPGRRWATTSLVLASVGGAMAARLLLHVAAGSRLRFLSHALTYSILTFRVCLIVLLVLF